MVGKSKDEKTAILRSSVFAQTVETQPSPQKQSLGPHIKLVAWNIRYCRHVGESAKLLADLKADVVLLSEMGYGLACSGQQNTAARLAEELGCGYIYGVEFLSGNQANDVGYRGNVILSRAGFQRSGLIRLSVLESERTIGGRVAALTTINVGGTDVVFASVHLENLCSPSQRAQMMQTLLDGIEEYAPGAPAVVAGDLNTSSFAMSRQVLDDPDAIRQLINEDPNRFLNPVSHEPLFAVARKYGYDWEQCNIISKSTRRCYNTPLSLRGLDRNLDWFLVRGLHASEPVVVDATPADMAWPLSDHELICLEVKAG